MPDTQRFYPDGRTPEINWSYTVLLVRIIATNKGSRICRARELEPLQRHGGLRVWLSALALSNRKLCERPPPATLSSGTSLRRASRTQIPEVVISRNAGSASRGLVRAFLADACVSFQLVNTSGSGSFDRLHLRRRLSQKNIAGSGTRSASYLSSCRSYRRTRRRKVARSSFWSSIGTVFTQRCNDR